ncbi:MAG: EmrA/EmrK family multidrug efflux transporter periplasmic adaptor subunit [Pseudomonas fluorescens]|nr:MAG: EmrA/EmrK family multidrug efflux transporter periplasmic adaptor subunit [Pseudomonas fluorescens]
MTQSASAKGNNAKRKRAFLILGAVVAVAAIGYGAYWFLVGSNYVSTDNAYVEAEVAQVTPTINGIVSEILVNDTEAVKQGQVLIKLDSTDADLALAQADAQLIVAQTNLSKAQTELMRRQKLANTGAVSAEELTTAQSEAMTAGASVAQMEAMRNQAAVDLSRTTVVAPIDGVIAKRNVQLGQRVQAGTPMMAVVPLDKVYVNANFKEVQLRKVKIGQKVELHSDLYGSGVVYHGVVQGLAGGTGAAFSAIPAQNATGNWIKVVQRLPVRVQLDANELKAHPLQVGLSMEATIDISGE